MSTSESEAGSNIVVATQFRMVPPIDRDPAQMLESDAGVSIETEDGRRIALDPGDERSPGFVRVIDSLREASRPVAFELDANGRIARLFVPHVSPVHRVHRLDRGVLAIDLVASHGRHTLRDSNPNFGAFERLLRNATESGITLVVTEDDGHDILDVRPFPDDIGAAGAVIQRPLTRGVLDRIRGLFTWILCGCYWPFGLFRSVSDVRAQQIFDSLAARSCDPLTVPAPCIPFRYPDDGCWGRAHEMCRLMVADGLRPCKVWIEGGLYVATDNSPSCGVWWGWHVAPTLCVRGSGCLGFFQVRSMVIDPALFKTPVTKAQWKGVQGDTNATLTDSSWTTFYLWGTSTNNTWFSLTDATFAQTNSVLAHYRASLQTRAIQYGPPPYACP
jgi:Glutaminase